MPRLNQIVAESEVFRPPNFWSRAPGARVRKTLPLAWNLACFLTWGDQHRGSLLGNHAVQGSKRILTLKIERNKSVKKPKEGAALREGESGRGEAGTAVDAASARPDARPVI